MTTRNATEEEKHRARTTRAPGSFVRSNSNDTDNTNRNTKRRTPTTPITRHTVSKTEGNECSTPNNGDNPIVQTVAEPLKRTTRRATVVASSSVSFESFQSGSIREQEQEQEQEVAGEATTAG